MSSAGEKFLLKDIGTIPNGYIFQDLTSIPWSTQVSAREAAQGRARRVYDGSKVQLCGTWSTTGTPQVFGVRVAYRGLQGLSYDWEAMHNTSETSGWNITFVSEVYFTISHDNRYLIYLQMKDWRVQSLRCSGSAPSPSGDQKMYYFRFSFNSNNQIQGIVPKNMSEWDGGGSAGEGCLKCFPNSSPDYLLYTFNAISLPDDSSRLLQFKIYSPSPYTANIGAFDAKVCCIENPADITVKTYCQDRGLAPWNTTCEPFMIGDNGVCKGAAAASERCIVYCASAKAATTKGCDTIYTQYCATQTPLTDKDNKICGCFFPPAIVNAYYDSAKVLGINIPRQPKLECSYQPCSESRIYTQPVRETNLNESCLALNIVNCVSNITLDNSGAIKGDINVSNDQKCNAITRDGTGTGTGDTGDTGGGDEFLFELGGIKVTTTIAGVAAGAVLLVILMLMLASSTPTKKRRKKR